MTPDLGTNICYCLHQVIPSITRDDNLSFVFDDAKKTFRNLLEDDKIYTNMAVIIKMTKPFKANARGNPAAPFSTDCLVYAENNTFKGKMNKKTNFNNMTSN